MACIDNEHDKYTTKLILGLETRKPFAVNSGIQMEGEVDI